jgi:iron complex transport system ATP-binding protein
VRRAAGDPLAEAHDVSIARDGRPVVHNADLSVRAGEVVALVGPNGAGKSTLLSSVAGDVGTAGGAVLIDGEPLASWTPTELAMRRAVLPQTATVSFPFTVHDIVRMGRAPWARTAHAEVDDAVIADALAVTDTAHLATRPHTALSGGERARVALARVCAQDTQLLLLDEPTAALDVRHQELVLELVRRRAARDDGVVVVLHDLGLAARHVDRVVLIAAGRVVADGRPRDVLEPQVLSTVYDHEIEVLPHPRTGALLIVPRGGHDRGLPRPGNYVNLSQSVR